MQKFVLISLLAISSLFANADCFVDKPVVICNTNFYLLFEDDSLSQTHKRSIVDDIILLRNSWTNSIMCFEKEDNYDGYIYDVNVEYKPYANTNIVVPIYFKTSNSTNYLWVSKNVSSCYTNALAYFAVNSNAYVSARTFVSLLSNPAQLDALPINQANRLVFNHDWSMNDYIDMHSETISDIKKQNYKQPSILSFYQTGPGTNGFPNAALWMKIPVITHPTYSETDIIDCFHAIWYDDMWRLYPHE